MIVVSKNSCGADQSEISEYQSYTTRPDKTKKKADACSIILSNKYAMQCLAGDMWVKAISEFGGHIWLNLPTWSTVDDLKVRPQRYSEHDNVVSVAQQLHLCVFVFCQVRWSNYTWQECAKNTFCVIGRRRVNKAATRFIIGFIWH